MSSNSLLQEAIVQIRDVLSRKPPVHEAIVRQGIILRVLYHLGFDIWNIDSVSPEETNSGGFRPDFVVRHGAGVFVIEIKGSGIKLQPKDFQQTINYIGSLGMRYAILTNGIVWHFVDERMPGRYDERIAFTLDMFQYEPEDFSELLTLALDINTWSDGLFHFRVRQILKLIESKTGGGSPNSDATIMFYYRSEGLNARVIYDMELDTWTVLSGSTASSRLRQYGNDGFRKNREKSIAEGSLVIRSDGLLEFREDVIYRSASSSIQAIVGGHRNGWDQWRDEDGNKAIKYKPEYKIKNRGLDR